MTGRGRRRLAATLAALTLVAGPGAQAALAVGNGTGSAGGCQAGVSVDVPAASTPGTPVPVTTTGDVTCPTPESQNGTQFGPGGPIIAPPVPGTDCVQQVNEPMELSLVGTSLYQVFWPDPTWNGNGSNTPEPRDVARVISGISAKDFFMQGGKFDYFLPFTLKGKWNATATACVPKDKNDPQASYTWDCPGATIDFNCLLHVTNGPVDGVGYPITGVDLVNLRGQMTQLIRPGQIVTAPAEPHPGLVNTPTCFFVNGANIAGQDVNQPQRFEMVLLGPPDAEGRRIFYVFRIELNLDGVAWQFGDSPDSVNSPPRDPACDALQSRAPLQFSHVYLTYSPPAGFPVVATETFKLHVTEYWADANGPHPPKDLGDLGLPPIQVNPAPGGFHKHIVQEEGVPVGT